jgi:hypothetical protein
MTVQPQSLPGCISYPLNIGQMSWLAAHLDDVDKKRFAYRSAHKTEDGEDVPGQVHVPGDLDAKYAGLIGEARGQELSDPTQLDLAKSGARQQVVRTADQIGEAMKLGVPRSEVDAFAIKEEAARTYMAPIQAQKGSGSVPPEGEPVAPEPSVPAEDERLSPPQKLLLQSEADITGESLEELSRKIIVRADGFRVAAGTIAGLRRKTVQMIDEAATVAEVEALLRAFKPEADEALKRALGFKAATKAAP